MCISRIEVESMRIVSKNYRAPNLSSLHFTEAVNLNSLHLSFGTVISFGVKLCMLLFLFFFPPRYIIEVGFLSFPPLTPTYPFLPLPTTN